MASNPQSSGPQPLRPSIVGSTGPPQNFGPPMLMQYRPVVPTQQAHQFIPAASQQFRPVGQGMAGSNVGMPSGQSQVPLFSQPSQHLPPRSGQPGQVPPSSQAIPMPYIQPNRPITSGSLQPQQNAQLPNNHLPNLSGIGMPLSSSYTFATSYGQPPNIISAPSQYQPASQMHAAVTPAGGQPWSTSETQNVPLGTSLMQAAQAAIVPTTSAQPGPSELASSDWQEHTAADGKRYYFNKKTRQSSWEKPLELMTPIEMSFGTSGAKNDCSIRSL